MEDRELLEMAAKAAGHRPWGADCEGYPIFIVDGLPMGWNPLTDDGDAFKLAVKLRFTVQQSRSSNYCYAGIPHKGLHAGNDEDQSKATRYAIVSAAAEIGRSIK